MASAADTEPGCGRRQADDSCRVSHTVGDDLVLARPQNDYDSLYIKADKALYRAKKEGHNTYFIA
ncbi:hypothetical protein FYJ45_15580 [Eisenbergiella tayi]|uniref:Diguanylate cyclase n=1 Tax=Eisenbergiella porci TaxID=2652274 RepID=A0A6N7W512_9FIRM|nr:hypothetical protein [Eisenbergiella massiliensis]MSS89652.1 hypothetical protein [Eisenbergiella porci]